MFTLEKDDRKIGIYLRQTILKNTILSADFAELILS